MADRSTREPFDPALKLHARIKAQAMARGLMVYPMGGTIDGRRGDHVLLAPPFIVSDAELDLLVERLGRPRFTWGSRSLVDASATRQTYIAALQAADARDMAPLLAFVRS